MQIKKKPCKICCENGDCSDKYIKARNLCAFHYKTEKAILSPSESSKSKSGMRIPHKGRKFNSGQKKGRILDFNATVDILEGYSISELKRVCDFWFRKYLIVYLGNRGKSFILCPLSNRKVKMQDVQVCHFIDRAKMILRYSEDNCILCSEYSNVYEARIKEEGYKSLHHKKFEEYIGAEKTKKLNNLSQQIVIYTKQDYINMIQKFKSVYESSI